MSDWHDVENNLAFPPRENITSNNLTDDWRARKLDGEFWVKLSKPTGEYIERRTFVKGALHKEKDPCVEIVEVLAPCDYDHFVELTDKVEEFKKDIQTLTNNYKLLEKKQASDIAHSQALVDEFGDFEVLYEELQRLREENNSLEQKNSDSSPLITAGEIEIDKFRELLKECQKVLSYYGNSKLPCGCSSNIHYDNQTALNLLTRINEVLK